MCVSLPKPHVRLSPNRDVTLYFNFIRASNVRYKRTTSLGDLAVLV